MKNKKLLIKIGLFSFAFFLVSILGAFITFKSIKAGLPEMITVKDYHPLLVSEVFDRNNKKIGEFEKGQEYLRQSIEKGSNT